MFTYYRRIQGGHGGLTPGLALSRRPNERISLYAPVCFSPALEVLERPVGVAQLALVSVHWDVCREHAWARNQQMAPRGRGKTTHLLHVSDCSERIIARSAGDGTIVFLTHYRGERRASGHE